MIRRILPLLLCAVLPSAGAGELLMNGSFEDGMEDWRYFSMKGEVERLDRST